MATQVLDIQVSANGAKTVVLDIKQIGSSARESANAVNSLNSMLASVGSFLAVDKLKQWADAWASVNGQIRVNTVNTQQATAVTQQLFQASQRTRQDFTQMVALYNRMATSVKDLGVSQSQMIELTQRIGEILAYSHVSAGQASGALLQLSQALGSGIVHAQEFNSVLQGAPAILQVAANHIDAAGGSVTKLRQIMLQQKLTSKQLFDAILAGGNEIDQKFDKSAAMISQAFAVLNNSMTKVVGQLNETVGAGDALTKLAQEVDQNLDQISAGLVAVGAGMAVAFSPVVLETFASALKAVWILLLENPVTAIATALATVVTYLYEMRESLSVTSDGFVKLSTVLQTMWPDIQSGSKQALTEMKTAYNDFLVSLQTGYTNLPEWASRSLQDILEATTGGLQTLKEAWNEYFQGLDSGVEGYVEANARVIDSVVSTLSGAFAAIKTLVVGFPQLINQYLTNAFATFGIDFAKVVSGVESAFEHLYNMFARIFSAISTVMQATVSEVGSILSKFGFSTTGSSDSLLGKSIAAYQQNSQNNHTSENYVRDLFSRSAMNQVTQNNTADLNKTLENSVNQSLLGMHGIAIDPITTKAKNAQSAINKLNNEIRHIVDTIQPAAGAVLEYNRDMDLLHQGLVKGLITQKDFDKYVQLVGSHYEEILDPVRKYNREIDEQTSLLTLGNRQLEVQNTMREYEDKLRNKNYTASENELKTLRSKVEAYYNMLHVQEQYNQIEQDTIDKVKQGNELQQAALELLQQRKISLGTAQSYEVTGAVNSAQGRLGAGVGSTQDIMTAAVGKARDGFTNVASGLSDTFGQFFSDFEDGFANSIGKAITGTETFGKAMKEVATEGIQDMIAGLVKLGEQYLITQALGATLNTNLFGGLFGGSAAATQVTAMQSAVNSSTVGSAVANSGWAFMASGGYTGDGNKYDAAGLVHKGEYVMNAATTARLGVDTLDALQKGEVTSKSSNSTASGGGSFSLTTGDVIIQNPTITDGKMDAKTMQRTQKQVEDLVKLTVQRYVTNQQRPGGLLWG